MDTAPYIITEHASVQRTYRMFRTLGLRHLIVIDRKHHVLGIVTRDDLMVTRQDILTEKLHLSDQENSVLLAKERTGSNDQQETTSTITSSGNTIRSRREQYLNHTIDLLGTKSPPSTNNAKNQSLNSSATNS
jgi:CBS-domain-containing membrane protein